MSRRDRLPRPGFEESWRRRFTEFATRRDDDAGIAGWSESGLDARFRQFVALWQRSGHGKCWLDAGCGAGTYSRFVASQGGEVVGLDYCLPAVEKAKVRDTWNCQWIVADVTRLPFQPGGFDGVLCFGVMQALVESEPAVRELAAQVKPGGEVWIDVLNSACIANMGQRLYRRWRGKPMHLRYESPQRIKQVMQHANFADVQIRWIPIAPARLKWLQPLFETNIVRALLHRVPLLGTALSHSCLLIGIRHTGN
jgi:ubiquinone/menaquinone biosynthesis C-methylase UbiE